MYWRKPVGRWTWRTVVCAPCSTARHESKSSYEKRTCRDRRWVQRTMWPLSRLRRLNATSSVVSDSSWPSSDGSWRRTLLLSLTVLRRRHRLTDTGTTRRRLRRTSSVSSQSRPSSVGSRVRAQSTRVRLRSWRNALTSGRLLIRVCNTCRTNEHTVYLDQLSLASLRGR